jgi:hypothetical protein
MTLAIRATGSRRKVYRDDAAVSIPHSRKWRKTVVEAPTSSPTTEARRNHFTTLRKRMDCSSACCLNVNDFLSRIRLS